MAKFSFMFGLVQVSAALTSAFSREYLIEVALHSVTWQTLFNSYGVFGIILLVLGAIYIRNPVPVVGGMTQGFGDFFASVLKGMAEVAKIAHVWIASIIGAAQFGVMLALGVVWAPKLLMVHGISQSVASFGSSMLWLGLEHLTKRLNRLSIHINGANQIQHPRWYKGASHEWESLIPTICANVSLLRSKPAIPVWKLPSCTTWL